MATLVFLVCVVSFNKYDVLGLVPFVVFPVVLASESGMPSRELAKRLAIAAPFALVIGIFNPILDQQVVATIGPLTITAGMVSYVSIIARFLLTTSAALLLVATTGMNGVCAGIERLGAPDVFSTQLLLLYRYIFVLAEEAMRLARARALRAVGKRGMGVRVYGNIMGHLLLRAVARRSGSMRPCSAADRRTSAYPAHAAHASERLGVLGAWSFAFIVFLVFDVPVLIGELLTGLIS